MSKISQDFINNVESLYEEINTQQNDFLNEDSEYYDQEAAELVEDIISTVSVSMIYEGYSANAVIGFLADSSEEEIIEKYLSFDESVLNESTVSEEYIEEQLEIFDFIISENLLKLGMRAASFLGRVASKPARMKAAERLLKSNNPKRTAAAYQKLANKNTAKAGFKVNSTDGAPASVRFKNTNDAARAAAMMKPIAKVKDVAKGAKTALTGPTAKKVALGAAGLGAAGLAGGVGGYFGAKLAGAGSGNKGGTQGGGRPETSSPSQGTPSGGSVGGGTVMRDPVRPSTSSGGTSTTTPKKSEEGPKGETPMQKWARLHPNLAAKVKPGQSGYGEISATRDKPGPSEKKDQTPTTGKPEAKIDTSSVEADIKKEQERLKKKAAETASTTKEAYEIVLEYLIDTEQVDTLEEAHYVMLEMDAETIRSIVENYEDCLFAEEVSEWVDSLVEEGYDLSEYTWDEIIEYYMTEARIDDDKTDDEKRTARSERGTIGYMHPFTKKTKKKRGEKTLSSTGKYSQMLHDKKQAQRERDGDEQRRRDRDAMSRGTWDKD